MSHDHPDPILADRCRRLCPGRLHPLTPAPRGYYGVQNGADYLRVAIATGVIVQIILGY